jgi:hypothetical protein
MAKQKAESQGSGEPAVRVRYIGDGGQYVIGHPAIPGHEEDVDPDTASALIDSGLYEAAPAAGGEA